MLLALQFHSPIALLPEEPVPLDPTAKEIYEESAKITDAFIQYDTFHFLTSKILFFLIMCSNKPDMALKIYYMDWKARHRLPTLRACIAVLYSLLRLRKHMTVIAEVSPIRDEVGIEEELDIFTRN